MKKDIVLLLEEALFPACLYHLWLIYPYAGVSPRAAAGAITGLGVGVFLARMVSGWYGKRRRAGRLPAAITGLIAIFALMLVFYLTFRLIARFAELSPDNVSLLFLSGIYAVGFLLIDVTLGSMFESSEKGPAGEVEAQNQKSRR